MEKITEKLITFEIAKLAKEKGFDIIIDENLHADELFYHNTGEVYNHFYSQGSKTAIAATQSLLQQWIIKTHNIIPFVKPCVVDGKVKYLGCVLLFDKNVTGGSYVWATEISYETFSEALEPALQKALNEITPNSQLPTHDSKL